MTNEYNRLHHRREILKLRDPNLSQCTLDNTSLQHETLSSLSSQIMIKPNFIFKETLYLPSVSLYKHSWRDNLKQRARSASLTSCEETHGELYPKKKKIPPSFLSILSSGILPHENSTLLSTPVNQIKTY